ncbi:MAG: type IV pilus twitching motility protein PilT [Candidatus Omnitrophica bacterium]|nr:type IV pilus twitching motility protein PilT [Candidatus Omnitrophota bacterium]
MIETERLLRYMVERRASDMHIVVGLPPQMRIDGELTASPGEALKPEDSKQVAFSFLTPKQIEQFEKEKELDCSFGLAGLGRFRINVFYERGSVAAAVRMIPDKIPSLDSLGLPAIAKEFAERPSGLVLVTGVAGSGKSTTLAAMIDHINRTRKARIVTIEDPIEYLHRHAQCTISQREIGSDCLSFPEALRRVMRQDPNIIMIGEMRDLETIRAALTLAETGHLIIATLHTTDATHAISRVIDVFPADQQEQIRVQLSLVLGAVIVQKLIPKKNGFGRVLACETMRVVPAIQNLIRDNDLAQMRTLIQMEQKFGTCSMNQSLARLYHDGLIGWEEAVKHTLDVDELRQLSHRTGTSHAATR